MLTQTNEIHLFYTDTQSSKCLEEYLSSWKSKLNVIYDNSMEKVVWGLRLWQAERTQSEKAATQKMEYPLNIDSESLLICDMNKLEDHLVHKPGYTETDVCNLIELLTAHPNRINLPLMIDIKVYIKSHIGYVGKDLTRYQLYFLTLNKLIGRLDILRITLQCLSNINRVRFLHTKHHGLFYKASLLHLIAQYPLTAKTTKTTLESIDESQHYQLLSSQGEYKYTPIHYACLYNNRQLLHIIIEGDMERSPTNN